MTSLTMRPLVVLVATKKMPGLVNMLTTLHKFGWQREILGLGQKWGGFGHKMRLVADFCKLQPPERVLIILDAYDALCLRSPRGFLEAFTSFNAQIVIGTETLCNWTGTNCTKLDDTYWDDPHNRYSGTDVSGNKYCNGGFVCGYAGDLHKVYSWGLHNGFLDDQKMIGSYIKQHYWDGDKTTVKIELDALAKLVINDSTTHVSDQVRYTFKPLEPEKNASTCCNDLNLIHAEFRNNASEPWFGHWPGCQMHGSFLSALRVTNKKDPVPGYEKVGRMVLGHEYTYLEQFDVGAQRIAATTMICLVAIMFVCLLILFVLHMRLRRQHQTTLRHLDVFTTLNS